MTPRHTHNNSNWNGLKFHNRWQQILESEAPVCKIAMTNNTQPYRKVDEKQDLSLSNVAYFSGKSALTSRYIFRLGHSPQCDYVCQVEKQYSFPWHLEQNPSQYHKFAYSIYCVHIPWRHNRSPYTEYLFKSLCYMLTVTNNVIYRDDHMSLHTITRWSSSAKSLPSAGEPSSRLIAWPSSNLRFFDYEGSV